MHLLPRLKAAFRRTAGASVTALAPDAPRVPTDDFAQAAGLVGYLDYRFDTRQLAWTTGQCKLFGIDVPPSGDLRGWFEQIDSRDREGVERGFWAACALRRQTQTLEYRVARARGTAAWLSTSIQLQYDSSAKPARMVGVTVDITAPESAHRERLQALERTARALSEAQARQAAGDELLARATHEMRNRLGAISAAVDVLQASALGGELAAEAQAIIARQTRQLSQILHDLRARDDDSHLRFGLHADLELEGDQASTTGDGGDTSITGIELPGLAGFELAHHAHAASRRRATDAPMNRAR